MFIVPTLVARDDNIAVKVIRMPLPETPIRNLVLILGDHLDLTSAALEHFDPTQDLCWMAEAPEESTVVWSHKARITLFLSAMRHHAQALRDKGYPLEYLALGTHPFRSLGEALDAALTRWRPQSLHSLRPGTWQLRETLTRCTAKADVSWEIFPNRNFFFRAENFAKWATGRQEMRQELWYRYARKQTGVLMKNGQPVGDRWNFDSENRAKPGAQGPGLIPAPRRFIPDRITREVIDIVENEFSDHPGTLNDFDWPVTAEEAREALENFITERLPHFGPLQDAFWPNQPWLYHSRLSAAMNLGLLSATTVVHAAEQAYQSQQLPIASVEGFIRQVLGWREYVRGLYWLRMPHWENENALNAHAPLPDFYWTGQTDMACLRDTIHRTLRYGYAHHIERLMITGLFSLLLGVEPQAIHQWFLAIYVDAVEWVELPNVLGMSQYADGGWMASKPYVASGRYLQRMGGHCPHCIYDPAEATGANACPFTTLYWDFLQRHADRFSKHPRTALQWKHLERMSPDKLQAIRDKADALKSRLRPTQQIKTS